MVLRRICFSLVWGVPLHFLPPLAFALLILLLFLDLMMLLPQATTEGTLGTISVAAAAAATREVRRGADAAGCRRLGV